MFSTKVLGIVGTGLMGTGIGIVGANIDGVQIKFMSRREEGQKLSQKTLNTWFEKQEQKGKLEASQRKDILSRISYHTKLDDLKDADFVIESISETFEAKETVLKQLSSILSQDTIIATNTSTLSITKLAGVIPDRAHQFVGMHFFTPVPVMTLVEVIRGLQTSDSTFDKAMQMGKEMKRVPIRAKDTPAFICNRMLLPYLNEAFTALMYGIGTPEDIDATMKLGCNVPLGPLRLADLVGLDVLLDCLVNFKQGLGEDKYRPCPIIKNYVDAGWLGVKSGRGVYDYSKQKTQP